MEKYGEIKPGITPPEDADAKKASQASADELQDHLITRAADQARDCKCGRKSCSDQGNDK